MWLWLAFLLVLFGALRYRCPYLYKDVQYVIHILLTGHRLSKYKESKPYYSVLDRFLESVQKRPHKAFIRFRDETYSYQDADKLSNKIARALLKHSNLKEGDTAALFMGNEPNYMCIWLGLAKIGCSAALLNYNMRAKSLLHCFSCCGANVLIVAAELKNAVEEVLPVLRDQGVSVFILTDESSTEGMESFSDKIRQASDEHIPADLRSNITFSSPAVYIYTSGTTGLPKAAVISHHRLWAISSLQSVAGVTSDDVVYVNLPLYHTAGFGIGFTGAIERGATVVLRSKFSASQFWDDCRKYNVTVMQYIGETMRYLCNTPKHISDPVHNVRIAIGNGIRADVWREFIKRFGFIDIREIYAATEGNISFINYTGKIGAVGRVNFFHRRLFPYALIKFDPEKEEPVRNSEGFCVEADRGETGLLVSRITQRNPFIGYARDLKQTEKKRLHDVFEKGDAYFNTGDLLRVDEDNLIYFQDRIGDTFRWKGENVATNEVSDILSMVPCIQEANVYGVKVPGQEGRVGMAAITLREGEQFDCIGTFSHVNQYLPVYARPRFIRIQNSLALTGTFKQMKVKLVEEGFNPATIQDPLYLLDEKEKCYQLLTQQAYDSILQGNIKL
ncbi:very long-chain acyl-CoA synthetase isoform X1 [Chanos chanos]|uniref:long-chain-fatty-acid--CoA ligase n=1 Tax=Chanos chanos TaxID=29144 RepID=A0A6J2UKX8_CHACN|nr:very long-chain acyl-CoA synthetase-like isoform X1 [Chanos chanos]